MKTGIVLLICALFIGCGSSDSSTCFPLGNGKYCIDDADCQLQADGKVLCTPGSNYGTMFAAVNEKDGRMQLCVKNKDTGNVKCFDPESECSIGNDGQLSCQRTDFMADDTCLGQPCEGACAQCGQYTWCASNKDLPNKAGMCVNACEVGNANADKATDDACANFPTCPVCICFVTYRQFASYDIPTGQYSACKPLPRTDCATATAAKIVLYREALSHTNGQLESRFIVDESCQY